MVLHCALCPYKIESYTKYDILHVRDDLWSKASEVMSNIPKGINSQCKWEWKLDNTLTQWDCWHATFNMYLYWSTETSPGARKYSWQCGDQKYKRKIIQYFKNWHQDVIAIPKPEAWHVQSSNSASLTFPRHVDPKQNGNSFFANTFHQTKTLLKIKINCIWSNLNQLWIIHNKYKT